MLYSIVSWLMYDVFGLNAETALGRVVHFFIYDSLKILLLLFVMISVVGFLRTFLPTEKVKAWITQKKALGNLFAALFGSVTPFCSCSSIPIFLSFLKADIPLGVTFSFLITSPLINEYLVVLMLGFFGWKITALYIISGITIGVASGMILGRMRLEKYIITGVLETQAKACACQNRRNTSSRIVFGINEACAIIQRLWLWIIFAVGIGAVIHNYVPQHAIQLIIQKTGVFSVPIATILGVPMYGSCAAIIPIAVALFEKGLPLGTSLAFMMATAALSLPEAILLRRALKLPLIIIFFCVTAVSIIFTGYLFNMVQSLLL